MAQVEALAEELKEVLEEQRKERNEEQNLHLQQKMDLETDIRKLKGLVRSSETEIGGQAEKIKQMEDQGLRQGFELQEMAEKARKEANKSEILELRNKELAEKTLFYKEEVGDLVSKNEYFPRKYGPF